MAARKKSQGFNLAQLDTYTKSIEGVRYEIKHPVSGDPIGSDGNNIALTVLGPASPQYRKAQSSIMKSLLNKKNDGKKSTELDSILEDEYEKQNLEVVLACVTGWENVYYQTGDDPETDIELEFSKDNLKMLMERCPWMRRQVESFIVDERNFMNG